MATVTSIFAVKPIFLQAVGSDAPIDYPADVLRHIIGAVWRTTGVLRDTHFAVTQRAAGANFSVDIASGYAVVGGGIGNQRYLVYNAGPTNVALTGFVTNPAATRTHKVWLAVYDKAISGTLYEAQFVITEDTGSGAPTPPDNPSYYIQLASFTISPSQSSVQDGHITDVRTYAALNLSKVDQLGAARTVENLTLETGIISGSGTHGGETPKVQIYGSTVGLRGTIARSGAATFTNAGSGTYHLFTLPTLYRPTSQRRLLGATQAETTSNYDWRLEVRSDGVGMAYITTASNPLYLCLDGMYYEKD